MDVNTIIDLAIDQTHVSPDDYPRTRVLPYLNLVKNNFRSAMVAELWEDYIWDIFKTDSVVNQVEYTLPAMATDTSGTKKVRGVSIKYDGVNYTRATEVKPWELKEHWSYYQEKQDTHCPIYYIADNSIFIAPLIKTVIKDAIELKGLKNIPDYSIDGLESTIWFPVDSHDVLIQGILPYILKSQGKGKESQYEKNEYIRMRDENINTLTDRNPWPSYMTYPEDREPDSNLT